LLHPEQDFHGDRRVQPGEADLSGPGHGRFGQPPHGLVRLLAAAAQDPQPLQVRITVGSAVAGKLARAGDDCAHAVARQRRDIGPADEGGHVDTETLLRAEVLRTQRLTGGHPRAGASADCAGAVVRAAPACSARRCQQTDIVQAQPGRGETAAAVQADPGPFETCGPAARCPADRPAKQRMLCRECQDPGLRVPAGLGQEHRLDPVCEHSRRRTRRHPAENTARIGRLRYPRHDQPGRPGRAHGFAPARSRGEGTASTAARSRPGSGCAYTCVEDALAWPSRSCASSRVPPASSTFEANA